MKKITYIVTYDGWSIAEGPVLFTSTVTCYKFEAIRRIGRIGEEVHFGCMDYRKAFHGHIANVEIIKGEVYAYPTIDDDD